MKTSRIIAVIVAVFLYPYSVSAAISLPTPNVRDWKVVSVSRIELRISDDAVVYLGLEMTYNNPKDIGEFVKVFSRHIPLPVAKPKPTDDHSFNETAGLLYAQKAVQDILDERSKQADPFLYIQWRTEEDPRTLGNILSGDMNIWFMPADGEWVLIKNQEVAFEFLTENIVNGESHNVFSGMEYRLGSSYHILKVSRDDIVQLLEGGK